MLAFHISDKRDEMQFTRVVAMLRATYWACSRDEATIRLAMDNSLCFGAFEDESGLQIGFARVLTDFATTFYLCDVIVDEAYRGQGVGTALVRAALSDERMARMRGLLATRDAHALYRKFGFAEDAAHLMGRIP